MSDGPSDQNVASRIVAVLSRLADLSPERRAAILRALDAVLDDTD